MTLKAEKKAFADKIVTAIIKKEKYQYQEKTLRPKMTKQLMKLPASMLWHLGEVIKK